MTTGPALTPVVRSLRGIAPLIADLVAQVAGLRSRPDDGTRSKALEAPLPLNLQALDDANALFRHLADEVVYSASWLEQLPPIVDAWRNAEGAIIGLRAHMTPAQAHHAACELTEWLEDHLEQLPEHAVDGLLVEVRTIAKRYPFRDRPHLSTTAVCPDCSGALRVQPPRHLGVEQTATCIDCGVKLGEGEYQRTELRYAAVLARANARSRAMGVAARLAAKYATA